MKKFIALFAFLFSSFLAMAQTDTSSTNLFLKIEKGLLGTVIYSLIGLIIIALSFKVIDWITPGHLAKQLAHDRNTALAIVIAGAMIGISIIVAAAII